MFERYCSFFYHSLLSCRYVMHQKRILSKPKWGRGTSNRQARPPAPPPPIRRDGTAYRILLPIKKLVRRRFDELDARY